MGPVDSDPCEASGGTVFEVDVSTVGVGEVDAFDSADGEDASVDREDDSADREDDSADRDDSGRGAACFFRASARSFRGVGSPVRGAVGGMAAELAGASCCGFVCFLGRVPEAPDSDFSTGIRSRHPGSM